MDEETKQLTAVMKRAVQLGLFPAHVDQETYTKHWEGMREIMRMVQAPLLEVHEEWRIRFREEAHRANRYENDTEHLRAALEDILADLSTIGVEPFSAARARVLLGKEPRDA